MSSHKSNRQEIKLAIYFLLLVASCIFIYDYFENKKIVNKEIKTPISVKESNEVAQEVLELLGKAETYYGGGTDGRHKNIELGIAHINGTTILPGEEFSFKKALGSVTAEDGYSEEKVFLNGEVTKGVGGGLCQVSTVLFRTALDSGLPIAERANHSFTVSRYDVGLDATYSDPGPDFKFKNDTDHSIVIKGHTENLNAIFEIYGVRDGRIASTTEPEIINIVDFPPTRYVATTTLARGQPDCVNTPQIGYTTKVIYNVLYPSGEYKENIFTSKYKPLGRVCYVELDKIKNFDINKMMLIP